MMRTSAGLLRTAVARTTVCAGLLGLVMFAAPANATSLISDFNNLAISGAYNNFTAAGVLSSGPGTFHITAGDFGGMFTNVSPAIVATGATDLELKLDVNPNNDPLANKFNVVLFDNDPTPTQVRFEFKNVPIGAGQTLTLPVGSAVTAAAGSIPGFNYSAITQWHFQGTFSNGDPGKKFDLTLDNLALLGGVPEPSTLALAGIASVAGLIGFRRRSA